MLKGKQRGKARSGALTIAIFVVVALFSTTSGQAKKSTFSARSLGAVSCSTVVDQLTDAEGNDALAGYTLWLSGYVTSKNISSGFYDVFPVLSPTKELVQFFANICSSNPNAKLVEVVEAALMMLTNKGYALAGRVGNPEIVVISHDGGDVPVYLSLIHI